MKYYKEGLTFWRISYDPANSEYTLGQDKLQ